MAPVPRRLKYFLLNQVEKLKWTEVKELQSNSREKIPHWDYTSDGMHLQITPIAVDKTRRLYSGSLGSSSRDFHTANQHEKLRNKLIDKAKKYGALHMPFIITVNSMNSFSNEITIREALFGTEEIVVSKQIESNPKLLVRHKRDGLWTNNPKKPSNTHVSGVLVIEKLYPWSIHTTKARLYHNPWATYPLNRELTELPQAIPENSNLNFTEGKTLGEIFNLPKDWLEPE